MQTVKLNVRATSKIPAPWYVGDLNSFRDDQLSLQCISERQCIFSFRNKEEISGKRDTHAFT